MVVEEMLGTLQVVAVVVAASHVDACRCVVLCCVVKTSCEFAQ